jgi:hypothetical protein
MSHTGNTSATTNPKSQKPESSESEHDSDGCLWDVQEVLAERSSISGENELLVVWKPSWIPKSNMMPDGPVMKRFRGERKWRFDSAAGNLQIPVQDGTTLMHDCATAAARRNSLAAPSSSKKAKERVVAGESGAPPVKRQTPVPATAASCNGSERGSGVSKTPHQ